MSSPDGVLAAIDACLDDMGVSDDAMRWAPDEPDPTPRHGLTDRAAEWVEEHTGFRLTEWQRHYLNALTPVTEAPAGDEFDSDGQSSYAPGSVVWSGGGWPDIRDERADRLRWATDISPAREAIADAIADELAAPTRDGLLRISMPDSSESFHRVVAVTPGETPGSYVMTLAPALPPETSALPEEDA